MHFCEMFDEFLLGKIFEPFTQWFQRLTGISAFWWARVCLVGMIIYVGMWNLIANDSIWEIGVPMVILALSLLITAFPLINKLEHQCNLLSQQHLANPCRCYRLIRLIWFPYFVLFWLDQTNGWWLKLIGYSLMVSSFYFISCNILPPSNSKIGTWLASLFKRLQPA